MPYHDYVKSVYIPCLPTWGLEDTNAPVPLLGRSAGPDIQQYCREYVRSLHFHDTV